MKITRIIYAVVWSKFQPSNELPDLADMLRYDKAFQNKHEPLNIAFPVFQVPKYGTFGGKITLGRWSSFGVRIREVPESPIAIQHEEWITYLHAAGNDSGPLYPATLAQFRAAKDVWEIQQELRKGVPK